MMHALILATALSTSAQAADGPPVEVRPLRIANVDAGFSGASFDVVLEAERTRGLPVKLRSLDYTIQIGKTVIAEGSRDYDSLKLKKGQPVKVKVPVELSAGQALKAVTKVAAGRDLKIKVKGTAGLKVWFIPFTVPFSAKGP